MVESSITAVFSQLGLTVTSYGEVILDAIRAGVDLGLGPRLRSPLPARLQYGWGGLGDLVHAVTSGRWTVDTL